MGRTAQRSPHLRTRLRGDRGDANTVQQVLLFPVLLLFFFALVQGGLYWHARDMALTAAESGVREGRIAGSAQVGVAAAQDFLDGVANETLVDSAVSSAGSTADEVTLTVTATVPGLFPGLFDLPVSQTSRGPMELPR